MSKVQEFDAIVVGGGFSGVHQLIELRKLGLKVRLLEAGSGLGGFNSPRLTTFLPSKCSDSPNPVYQLSDPDLWKDWTFSEKFAGGEEIQEYFKYVDRKRDLSRDISYNSLVVSAAWDDAANRWTVTTESGDVYRAEWVTLCVGISARNYVPTFKGIETFKGKIQHTYNWPKDYDLKGKKVGIIGTGASGVQVIQECGPIAEHLTVFQRTPNLALPMRQANLDPKAEENKKKTMRPYEFGRMSQTLSGYLKDIEPKSALEVTPEERVLCWEDAWEKGGLLFWTSTYGDIFFNDEINDLAYDFWKQKVRERINNPEVAELLAPSKKPHPFGMKRPSLEQNYYEIFNQSNVKLVDVKKNPILEITPNGVKTSDGTEHELDVLVLATGFDMVNASITSIDVRGQDGIPIKEKWADGVRTHLGLGTAGYPNLFWVFGPQHPLAFSNAPSSIEPASDWVAKCIKYCRDNGVQSITATNEAQEAWNEQVQAVGKMGLYYKADSWYIGANIPGKKREMLQFAAGVPTYIKALNDSAQNGYSGWVLKKATA
ncbi:hypothetical protein GYMLUDRAFT_246433 [Collybiopsis luxurians FD-317 M1]|uniref:FAD/NAD(P)-binding domain-containing protein n=1 Tax=Collybiopsis luxurians FD-317 M1 TaxID=944289 RepID=A0A0D0BS22_9AGAR|nr:hypothetical protein GYMLUDRAFT_246433 [Collybiopsis luxurians FD-317 M1]